MDFNLATFFNLVDFNFADFMNLDLVVDFVFRRSLPSAKPWVADRGRYQAHMVDPCPSLPSLPTLGR